MKKTTTLLTACAFIVPFSTWAQNPKRVVSNAQINAQSGYEEIQRLQSSVENPTIVSARPIGVPNSTFRPNGKTAAISPIPLGTSSNGIGRMAHQNQVLCVDSLNLVAYIHRQNVTIWGGGSTENGKFRYDISTDGGSTFTNDIGPMQTAYTTYGRYPQVTGFNPGTTTNPFDSKLVWQGATNRFPTPGWLDHTNGISEISTTTATSTEHYQFLDRNPEIPGGLCQGLPGEFWTVAPQGEGSGSPFEDTLLVFKGVYNTGTQDIDWQVHSTLVPGFDKSFDSTAHLASPNIAFSPDGQHGWISLLSNIGTGPKNQTYLPVLWHSTDGGATWSAPTEVDLDLIPWIADSLQSLWLDSLGNPASSGLATTGFEADITVDEYGDVHMGVLVGTTKGEFRIEPGLAKFIVDLHSVGQGASWDAAYISPVLCFRGFFGTSTDPYVQDQFIQVSRDERGTMVFLSWADTDTAQFSGNQTGVGFGTYENVAPNLRIGVRRVIDGAMVYPKLVTDGDLVWEGRALSPTMAPVVHREGSRYELPLVLMDMLTNDMWAPCAYYYFGNDAFFDFSVDSWCNPSDMDLGWTSWGYSGATPPCAVSNDVATADQVVLGQSYPNPTANETYIVFELPAATNVKMTVTNMYGQVVRTVVNGDMAAGSHKVTVDTRDLAPGVYFYTLEANGNAQTKKMIVSK